MNELIEELKKNLAEFAQNTSAEKDCFREVGIDNCVVLSEDGVWYRPLAGDFQEKGVYQIKSPYKPEPDVERCKVAPYNFNHPINQLSYVREGNAEYVYKLIEALADPDFMYFEYEEDEGTITCPRLFGSEKGNSARYPKFVVFARKVKE